MLGYDILDLTETGSFDNNVTQAKAMGMNFISIHLPWNSLDVVTNIIDPGNTLAILNGVAIANNLKLAIIISPIDIPGRNCPTNMNSVKFTNEIMVTRFNALVDFMFNSTNGVVDPSIVTALSVGNEIDAYNWIGNGDTQLEYQTFLSNIKPKINSYGVKLNFTGSHGGLIEVGTTYTDMAKVVDAVSVTYYPQGTGFQVHDPSVAQADLDALVAKFPGKEIHLQEVGYQTSASCGSSEAKQADFFANFFTAWDSHATNITQASILRFNDNSLAAAQSTAIDYGLTGDTNFIEYIRTLGLRTWDGNGTNKLAVEVISNAIVSRDW